MDWTIELVAIPVTDVDRAKAFNVDQVGSTPTMIDRGVAASDVEVQPWDRS